METVATVETENSLKAITRQSMKNSCSSTIWLIILAEYLIEIKYLLLELWRKKFELIHSHGQDQSTK